MFERTYHSIKERNQHLKKMHNWLGSKLDGFLTAIIREKISDLGSYAYKLSDKLMLYVFSIVFITFFYILVFYATQFIWLGYKGTHLGNIFVQGKSEAYSLVENFYGANDFFEIISSPIYCSIFLLIFLSITRLIFINRFFYENRPYLLTSLLWGVPLAKLISLHDSGGAYQIFPFLDGGFLLFLIPSLLILHPTMQFVNWTLPEVDDIYKNPRIFLRRFKVERMVNKNNP